MLPPHTSFLTLYSNGCVAISNRKGAKAIRGRHEKRFADKAGTGRLAIACAVFGAFLVDGEGNGNHPRNRLAGGASREQRMKRTIIYFMLSAVLGFWTFHLLVSPEERINPTNFAKISPGMTKEKVLSLLGSKPHFAPGQFREFVQCNTAIHIHIQVNGHVWKAGDFVIFVLFEGETVLDKMSATLPGRSLTVFESVRDWLNRATGLNRIVAGT